MKLEEQVCTMEQAVKLKTLGIPQKSLFYWHPAFERPVFGETWTTQTGKQYAKTMVCNDKKGSSSAFTVAELGVILPPGFDTMYCTNEGWRGYDPEGNDYKLVAYNTEAELRADMVISILEQFPDYRVQADWRIRK
jgi:hypothetical protein